MKILKHLTLLLPYFLVFLVFFLPAVDTDLGWHLRYGQYFLENRQILKENTFTYFLPDYKWAYSTGFFDLTTAIIFNSLGLLGLAFAYGLLGCALFFFLRGIFKVPSSILTFAFLIFSLFGWNVLYLGWRAQIFTILGTLIVLWTLKKSETNSKWLFLLPFIFAVWANTHGGFILGLLVLAIHFVSRCVVPKPLNTLGRREWRRICTSGVVLIVCACAVGMNPYGFRVYQESLLHANYPLQNLIAEWVKPTLVFSVSGTVIVGILVALLWKRKIEDRIFLSLVLILGLGLLLQAKRNTPIFALFTILPVLEVFKEKLTKLESHISIKLFSHLIIASAILILAIIQIPQTIEMSTNWDSYCNNGLVKLPCKSVDFIRVNRLTGTNVFTAYEWGGFLEWQLPQYKYFADGRMPAWETPSGKSPYTEYLEIIQAQPGDGSQAWEKKLEDQKTDMLLIGSGTFLDIELKQGNNLKWKELHRDETSVVYAKQTQALGTDSSN